MKILSTLASVQFKSILILIVQDHFICPSELTLAINIFLTKCGPKFAD